jgi:integrase
LIKIRKKDINLERGVIVLHDGQTKNGRGAILPIPPGMVEYFRSIPEECEYAFYRVIRGTSKVRRSPKPRYVALGCFWKSWKKVLEKAEIKDFHFHDLRHIACWNLAKNGTPESVIMRIGNWKTPEIFRRYRHISEDEITGAVQFKNESCIRFVYDATGTVG